MKMYDVAQRCDVSRLRSLGLKDFGFLSVSQLSVHQQRARVEICTSWKSS